MKNRKGLLALAMLSVGVMLQAQEQSEYEKFRFGGYGEMLGTFKDYDPNTRFNGTTSGSTKEDKAYVSIPRFVLAFDYKFNEKWLLGAEIEFEAGGVGVAQELESSENGEYETEMEKGGEVALEQFHITRLIHPAFNVRAGHLILPVGLTNAHHEPINFFGTVRPEGETTILPSTWHETGLELFGTVGRGYATFDYQLLITAGLNPDGFGRDKWVADGKQGLFEQDNYSSPAYTARVDYRGVKGLRVGASIYYVNDVTKNADKDYKYAKVGASSLLIWSADAQYKNKYITARANVISGELEKAAGISSVSLSNLSPYHSGVLRKVAKGALAYGGEVGVNLGAFGTKIPTLYSFVRYEYFNPQERADGKQTIDARCQVSKWTMGLNWFARPNLVVKADYNTRRIGTGKVFGESPYSTENEVSIGIAYIGWFVSK